MDCRQLRGELLDPDEFDDVAVVIRVERYNHLKNLLMEKPEAPAALTSLTSWETFCEAFILYLSQFCSAVGGTPLHYVIRDEITVTQEALVTTYADIYSALVDTVILSGQNYLAENKRVFNLFVH
jgi:hypothetical protein